MSNPASLKTQSLKVRTWSATDAGCVRTMNEDSCGIVQPTDPIMLRSKGTLLVVADGMGGCQAGEIASQLAVQVVAEAYYSSFEEPPSALSEALQKANSAVHSLSLLREEWNGMGTTCTALVLQSRVAHSAHVGDSRAYLVRANAIYQMTEDHSLVKELVKRGSLSSEAARRHPERNLILKALGSRATLDIATWEQPLPLVAGDAFVLCSDGLHDSVNDDEICEVIQAGDPAQACEALLALARERGGRDNITVVVAAMTADVERY
jgi:serine/threonine protein phosphatase PrpC